MPTARLSMARTAQVLHLAESPNDSFLLKAELAEEGIPCQLLALSPGEDLARAVADSNIDLLVVDVPLSSPAWRSGLDEIQRTRPELPVVFRWGGTGNWSTESSSEQIGRRIRGVLSLPDTLRRTDGERREFLDRLVRHQQTYLELLRSDFWNFDEAIKRIIERAADLLEVERVSVWEFTDDRKALVCLDLFVRSARTHERPRPVSSSPALPGDARILAHARRRRRAARSTDQRAGRLVPGAARRRVDARRADPPRRTPRRRGVPRADRRPAPVGGARAVQRRLGGGPGGAGDGRPRAPAAGRPPRARRAARLDRTAGERPRPRLQQLPHHDPLPRRSGPGRAGRRRARRARRHRRSGDERGAAVQGAAHGGAGRSRSSSSGSISRRSWRA